MKLRTLKIVILGRDKETKIKKEPMYNPSDFENHVFMIESQSPPGSEGEGERRSQHQASHPSPCHTVIKVVSAFHYKLVV